MKNFLLILFLCHFNSAYSGELIKSFESDGCSVFPDGTLVYKESWLKCCIEHDKAYWQGGSYQQRQVADETLKFCVEKIGRPEIAKIMLNGVRVGGTPYLPTSFRWGYGWPYLRGYKVLTEQEKQQVLKLINQ